MSDATETPMFGHRSNHDFVAYYQAVEGRPPRETLLTALAQFDAEPTPLEPRSAIDLGCGDGRDTVELLQRGWRVLGIDAQPEAIERFRSRTDVDLTQLETKVVRFEEITDFPDGGVDLINASFSLQFCPPDHFPTFWTKIVTALRSGGRFCGQLVGDRDSWAMYPTMTHLTREQVEAYLAPFALEHFEEEDHPGKTALGEEKHWHIFQIVARKH